MWAHRLGVPLGSQEKESQQEILYVTEEQQAHAVVGTELVWDLLCANRRPRTAGGIIQSQSEGPRTKGAYGENQKMRNPSPTVRPKERGKGKSFLPPPLVLVSPSGMD